MNTEGVRVWIVTAAVLGTASPALAANEGGVGVGVWMIFFLALGALIVAFQAIPALVMFGSILKALFAPAGGQAQAGEEVGKPT